MGRKKTWKEWAADCNKVHGDRYEYPVDQVLDKGYATRVKVTCKSHGVFEQSLYAHKRGRGCPECGSEKCSGVANEGSEVMCEDGIIRVIITCKKAKAKGLNMYFTGKPCKYGHISERYVSNGDCIDCNQGYGKQRRQENKEHIKEYNKRWEQENREHRNEYSRNRYATDESYKTAYICRRLLYRTLEATSSTKDSQTYEVLGYCNEEFHQNISQKFLAGMSWDNYGDLWSIDHVIPVSRYINEFGITDPAVINALDNLIPMWDTHNLEKSARTLEEYLDDNPDLYDTYGHFLKEQPK